MNRVDVNLYHGHWLASTLVCLQWIHFPRIQFFWELEYPHSNLHHARLHSAHQLEEGHHIMKCSEYCWRKKAFYCNVYLR
uniref:Uncharacterized protein n=1 Tax=Anguilla anguilla TaxID=7936 RepID=A0A0E9SGL7_ANGAN